MRITGSFPPEWFTPDGLTLSREDLLTTDCWGFAIDGSVVRSTITGYIFTATTFELIADETVRNYLTINLGPGRTLVVKTPAQIPTQDVPGVIKWRV